MMASVADTPRSTVRMIAVAILAAAIALWCPLPAAVAAPRGARLDPTYGRGGVAMTAFGVAGKKRDVELTAIPGGASLVADGLEGTAVRFGAGGSQDRHFGKGNRLLVAPGSRLGGSRKQFYPNSIVADSRGRVLVFGSQADSTKRAAGPERIIVSATLAAVRRFTADGRPDRGFGEGHGYVTGDFGLPAEEGTGLTRTTALTGRVDSQNRPLFVVGTAGLISSCFGHAGSGAIPRALVRLTESGQPDTTFGEGDGISPLEGIGTFPFLGIDAADQPAVGVESYAAGPCHIGTRAYRFGVEGEPLAAFGPGGAREFGPVRLALVEPSGALILDERTGRTLKLIEVDPEGNADPGFGEGGVAKVGLPDVVGLHLSPAAVDAKGRILLAGFVGSPISAPEKGQPRSSFALARLLPDGRVDHSFGRHGWLFTRLPGRRELISTQASLDPEGRLLIGGIVTRPHHLDGAFTVARYLLGP
jgi:uncharacterized delta-60 repeat protein